MGKPLYDFCIEQEAFVLLVQWDKENNNGLTFRDVSCRSRKKIWWRCERGHQWQAPVYARTSADPGCPYCKGKRLAPGQNTLASLFPDLAAQWHPTNNIGVTPSDVPPATHRKAWWICAKGHEWQAQINSRTRGAGCPVCDGKQVIPGENDLASAFPDIAAQWHPEKNGALTPQNATPFSNRKVWWICEKGHEYVSAISHRVSASAGCPYCAGRKVLAGFNDLGTMSPIVSAQWHPKLNGTLTPQMVTVGSHKKVWWQCTKGHVWKAVVYSRAGSRKTGCPVCAGTVKKSRQRYCAELAQEALVNNK